MALLPSGESNGQFPEFFNIILESVQKERRKERKRKKGRGRKMKIQKICLEL